MSIEELYRLFQKHPRVQTDTRKIRKGELFFALKGPSFDGNRFAEKALEQGAAYAIVDDKNCKTGEKTILVEDVLATLQALALHHRQQLNIPVIAITGSNGKTTTKELIHAVLSSHFKTCTTEGNLNNHIGVPLTLLRITPDAEFAVVEMGANHIGEIASYCRYAQPTHGLITNCGKAHLEGFGGVEGVKKGKGELYDHLRSVDHGHAFVMWDYEYLQEMSKGISGIIKYGTGEEAHVIGRVAASDPFLSVEISQGIGPCVIRTGLVGDYNLPNVLAAVTIGQFFKVPEQKIVSAITSYSPSNSRSQLVQKGSNRFVMDAYNANPSSMKLALENFGRENPGGKVVILGAMAELGGESMKEHQALVELLSFYPWKAVVLVGEEFKKTKHPFLYFSSAENASAWFRSQDFTDTEFLIKGSRSMMMEKVVEA